MDVLLHSLSVCEYIRIKHTQIKKNICADKDSNQCSSFLNSTAVTLMGPAMPATCKNTLVTSSIPGSRAS
jgi:hypothetical protein